MLERKPRGLLAYKKWDRQQLVLDTAREPVAHFPLLPGTGGGQPTRSATSCAAQHKLKRGFRTKPPSSPNPPRENSACSHNPRVRLHDSRALGSVGNVSLGRWSISHLCLAFLSFFFSSTGAARCSLSRAQVLASTIAAAVDKALPIVPPPFPMSSLLPSQLGSPGVALLPRALDPPG